MQWPGSSPYRAAEFSSSDQAKFHGRYAAAAPVHSLCVAKIIAGKSAIPEQFG
jgi:hypothetical protein